MLRFDGRVAIVTGAGRGIGRAHALLLAQRGAAVVVNDLGADLDGSGGSHSPADEVVAEIVAGGGRAVSNFSSVADPAGAAAIVASALESFGRLDIVINNAGFEAPVPFGESTEADLRRHLDVHLFGSFGVTLAAWPHLVASGAGRVVNTTSATIFGMANRTSYGTAKGAIMAFTKSLAVDGEPHGIKVNAIAPAAGTRMADGSDTPDAVKTLMREHMPPHLVAPAVAFLVHESCTLTGEVISVGGGRVGRITLCENAGFTDPDLSPESIAANLESVLDQSTAVAVPRVMFTTAP